MKTSELGEIKSVNVSFTVSSNYTELARELAEEEDPVFKLETVEELLDYLKDVFFDNFDENIWKEGFISIEINGKEYGFKQGLISESNSELNSESN